jgi:hypothetical protein
MSPFLDSLLGSGNHFCGLMMKKNGYLMSLSIDLLCI